MKNVSIKLVGELRSGTWFLGEFEMGLWSGRLVWFLLRNFGQQFRQETEGEERP